MVEVKTRTRTPPTARESDKPDNYADYIAAGGEMEYQDWMDQGRPSPGRGTGPGGSQDPGDPLERILALAEETGAENIADIDALIAEVMPSLKTAQARADFLARAGLTVAHDAYVEAGIPVEIPEYRGDVESQAALAEADPESIEAQKWTLDELQDRSVAEITPEERFMMETARREQERDVRSRREAALQDMSARGVRSGGAEMSALLGAEQATAESRQMQDLGAQSNAVKRAMQALGMHGEQAGEIREQSFGEELQTGQEADAIDIFNKRFGFDYDTYKTDFEQEERDKGFDRGVEIGKEFRDVGQERFGREKDVAGAKTDLVGGKVKTRTDAAGMATEALTGLEAQRAKDAAIAKLEEDDSDWWNPFSWG